MLAYRTLEGSYREYCVKDIAGWATGQSLSINIVMNETRSFSNDVVDFGNIENRNWKIFSCCRMLNYSILDKPSRNIKTLTIARKYNY
jgi:hypothetical protein